MENFERHKELGAYLRFITTLSTGSIVLIATFLEKVFAKPVATPLIITCLIAFLTSILGATLAYTIIALNSGNVVESPKAAFGFGVGLLFAWGAFLVAMINPIAHD